MDSVLVLESVFFPSGISAVSSPRRVPAKWKSVRDNASRRGRTELEQDTGEVQVFALDLAIRYFVLALLEHHLHTLTSYGTSSLLSSAQM